MADRLLPLFWILQGSILTAASLHAQGPSRSPGNAPLVFSTVKGMASPPDTVFFSRINAKGVEKLAITGEQAGSFHVISPGPAVAGKKDKGVLVFSPPVDFTGVAKATLTATDAAGKQIAGWALRGLSLNGLEGRNEPTLTTVFDALGYRIDPGWSELAHDLLPDRRGDEIYAPSFRKAGNGKVEIVAVARFSPDYELPFGYYIPSAQGPERRAVGILAKTTTAAPQHQTLSPGLASGTHSFDPGTAVFGIYTTSPTHTAYTSDDWNRLLCPDHAGHAARVYPAREANGRILADTYLVCFEEAANGDYQDYVFVIKNVRPVTEGEEYLALMNGKDLDGWDLYVDKLGTGKNPENNFSVEDSAVHVMGKYLGYIRTKKSFTNYDLKVEFKWGEKKWPPREGAKRDGGICYNIPASEPDSIWPKSIECQIQEGDVGDFWLLSYSTIEVDSMRNHPSNHTRIIKKKDAEKPTGEWNTVEVISYNGRCIQLVNGVVVNDGKNASIADGRILLQSEYSEIFYRRARIKML